MNIYLKKQPNYIRKNNEIVSIDTKVLKFFYFANVFENNYNFIKYDSFFNTKEQEIIPDNNELKTDYINLEQFILSSPFLGKRGKMTNQPIEHNKFIQEETESNNYTVLYKGDNILLVEGIALNGSLTIQILGPEEINATWEFEEEIDTKYQDKTVLLNQINAQFNTAKYIEKG